VSLNLFGPSYQVREPLAFLSAEEWLRKSLEIGSQVTEAVERIVRETWVSSLVCYAQNTHVLLVAEAVVTYPVVHDTECPSKVELDRLVVLWVIPDGKFATGSFLERPKFKPIAMRDKDRIKDLLTLSE
jgi:hypothetical protein